MRNIETFSIKKNGKIYDVELDRLKNLERVFSINQLKKETVDDMFYSMNADRHLKDIKKTTFKRRVLLKLTRN